mmetsp:Transcript_7918/g.25993  ORF Transcript_7918/g.25993 Transcript_7918/m.25993 type:complete len:207 (+) Transcript_7918:202-822(+)
MVKKGSTTDGEPTERPCVSIDPDPDPDPGRWGGGALDSVRPSVSIRFDSSVRFDSIRRLGVVRSLVRLGFAAEIGLLWCGVGVGGVAWDPDVAFGGEVSFDEAGDHVLGGGGLVEGNEVPRGGDDDVVEGDALVAGDDGGVELSDPAVGRGGGDGVDGQDAAEVADVAGLRDAEDDAVHEVLVGEHGGDPGIVGGGAVLPVHLALV